MTPLLRRVETKFFQIGCRSLTFTIRDRNGPMICTYSELVSTSGFMFPSVFYPVLSSKRLHLPSVQTFLKGSKSLSHRRNIRHGYRNPYQYDRCKSPPRIISTGTTQPKGRIRRSDRSVHLSCLIPNLVPEASVYLDLTLDTETDGHTRTVQ